MLEVRPLVEAEGVVVGGNMRLLAMKDLGYREVSVIDVTEWTQEKRDEFMIKDNLNFGDWDYDLLANEWNIDDLTDWGMDLWDTDPEEMNGLTDEDEVPEAPEAPITKLGDVWILGEHRVMCGDSTSKEAVEILMDGEKADMVFTDPPFPNNSKIMHEMIISIDKAFINARNFCDNLMIWFWDNISFPDFSEMVTTKHIWHKTNGWQAGHFETMYGYHNDNKRHEQLVFNSNSVGGNNKRETQGFHQTPKPLELIILIFDKLNFGHVILDLFLGSGSTLIAAEKTNRKCYGMELDPKYCDVIVKRWEDFTGKKATREIDDLEVMTQAH